MRQSNADTWIAAVGALVIIAGYVPAEDGGGAVEVTPPAPATPLGEDGTANHRDPTLCVDGAGGLYVGYVDSGRKVPTVMAIASKDDGGTFGEPVALTLTSDEPSTLPNNRSRSVAWPEGGVLHAWYESGVATGDIDLICAVSSDGGVTFEKRRQVETARQDVWQGGADLAVIDDDRLVAAWIDLRAGPNHAAVYGSVSADRGLTWEPIEQAWYTDVSASGGVRLMIGPKGKLYAAFRVPGEKESHDPMWAKIEVRRKGAIDPQAGKEVMRKPKRVREEPESPPAGICVSKSGEVGCLWRTGDARDPKLHYAISKNRGAMWKPPVELPIQEGSEPDYPQLARLPGGDILAAWEGFHDGGEAVFLSRSADGKEWSEPDVIQKATSLAIASRVAEKGLPIAFRSSADRRIHVAFLK